MDDFYYRVYEVVHRIPHGRVCTYGHIAAYLGLRSGSRMVGYALSQSNAQGLDVPAHRVVNRIGLLTGRHHFRPPELMQQLLEAEGVRITENQVKDFKRLLWVPT